MTAPASHARDPVATSEDLFLGGALRMLQPVSGYRAGLDAVLLAAACPVEEGRDAKCLDCGAGVGVAGLALARRAAGAHVTLVERDPVLAVLAQRNIAANDLGHRACVVAADLTAPLQLVPALADAAGTFDHITANPPYYAHGAGTRAADPLKDGSHAMGSGQLDDWIRFAAAMARDGGSLTLIHRADALPEILAAMARRFGGVRILPLHPRAGEPASRLLVGAIKGSRAALAVLPGRVLHQEGGHGFVPEFDAILRRGAGLEWAA